MATQAKKAAGNTKDRQRISLRINHEVLGMKTKAASSDSRKRTRDIWRFCLNHQHAPLYGRAAQRVETT